VLAMDRCAPHELRLVAVELQAVGLHPSGAATVLTHLVTADRKVSTCDSEQEP